MSRPKRVLLLNPTYHRPLMRDTFHPTSKSALYIWHPLDLLIQSGYLAGFDVRIHDGVVDNSRASLERTLAEFAPDAVLSLVAFPSLTSDLEILEGIKKRYGCTIFAVGDVTYGEREAFLARHEFLDGILADYTSRGFAQYLRGEPIRNAIWRDGDRICTESTHEPMDYATPRHDLLDLSAYYLPYWKPPFGSVYSSHGCPAKCRFCVAPGWGRPRFRDTEAVLDEVGFLYHRGVRKVFFRDGSFNQSPPRMARLLEGIAARYPGMRLTTWFKPKPLDAPMAKLMRAAGFEYVHIGVETGSPRFLRELGKDFALEEVEPGIDLLHRNGVKVVGHFMVGLPGERDEDYRLTLRYLSRTRLDIVSFSAFEYSFGIKMRNEGGPARPDHPDTVTRRRLYHLMARFYARPDRWPRIWFFEDLAHVAASVPRIARYAADLRLYPRFGEIA